VRLESVARYFFIVHDAGGQADNVEGLDLADLESARSKAITGARSMMSDSIGRGEIDLTAFIVIEDEKGTEVERVAFSEAISVRS
jgi:hypothetical protein